MYFYALETIKIQNHLRTASKVKQVWLVDDTTGAGSLKSLKKYNIINIIEEGGRYRYYVHESKTWFVLKNRKLLKKTEILYIENKINVTPEGKRLLGAVIGSNDFQTKHM